MGECEGGFIGVKGKGRREWQWTHQGVDVVDIDTCRRISAPQRLMGRLVSSRRVGSSFQQSGIHYVRSSFLALAAPPRVTLSNLRRSHRLRGPSPHLIPHDGPRQELQTITRLGAQCARV